MAVCDNLKYSIQQEIEKTEQELVDVLRGQNGNKEHWIVHLKSEISTYKEILEKMEQHPELYESGPHEYFDKEREISIENGCSFLRAAECFARNLLYEFWHEEFIDRPKYGSKEDACFRGRKEALYTTAKFVGRIVEQKKSLEKGQKALQKLQAYCVRHKATNCNECIYHKNGCCRFEVEGFAPPKNWNTGWDFSL